MEDFNSVDLLLLADKYNVVGLRRKCEKDIAKNIHLGEFFCQKNLENSTIVAHIGP